MPASPDLDLIRGTLDMLILKTLSWAPMHGLAVMRWIEAATKDQLQIEEGALYPALHRLEQRGWLDGDWGYTDQGRKAKFYRLNAAGRRQLTAELSKWARYTRAVGLVIAAEPARLATTQDGGVSAECSGFRHRARGRKRRSRTNCDFTSREESTS